MTFRNLVASLIVCLFNRPDEADDAPGKQPGLPGATLELLHRGNRCLYPQLQRLPLFRQDHDGDCVRIDRPARLFGRL